MLLSGLTNNILSLNLATRETVNISSSLSVNTNPHSSTNITLITLEETKLKIKDPELFYSERSKYKSFTY
jgi:hypothetical protein